MDCKTCVWSDWDYPMDECRECRGYSNHTTTLPLPGMCPGEEALPNIDPLYMSLLNALDTIKALNRIRVMGEGEDCTRAQGMITMLKHEIDKLTIT